MKNHFLNLIEKLFFNKKWTCNICGREIFNDKYFCSDCESKLPYIEGSFCAHCGRKTVAPEEYCSTCKNNLVSLDLCRSIFEYSSPIDKLIKKYKNYQNKYLAEVFCYYLQDYFYKFFHRVDVITFVPMFKKKQKKRGFNQSKLLAEKLSEKCKVNCVQLLEKVKETKGQKNLTRKQRLTNLSNAFRVVNKDQVVGKDILIIDDVTTTGWTAESLAAKLKKAKARKVYLLTIASVKPVEGY